MKIVPEFLLRHDLRLFVFVSTPTIDIEPEKIPQAILQHEEGSLWDSLCIEEHGKFARYAPLRRCIDRNTHPCSGAKRHDDISA